MVRAVELLGLSAHEFAILEYLKGVQRERVITISRVTDIARTTVHFLLKKLEKRKLVERQKVGKHYEWALNKSTAASIGLNDERVVEVKIGLKNFEEIYEAITHVPHGERIFVFQGVRSAKSAVSRIGGEFFSKLHDSFKKRRIVIEGLASEKVLDLFETMDTELLKSHWGRATVVHVVPNEFASFDADMVSVRDKLYLFNFEKEITIIVSNPSIAAAFHSLLMLAIGTSRHVNLNAHIQNILEKRGV